MPKRTGFIDNFLKNAFLEEWKDLEAEHLEAIDLADLLALEESKLSKDKQLNLADLSRRVLIHLARNKKELWEEKYDHLLMSFGRLKISSYHYSIHHDIFSFLPEERRNKVLVASVSECPKLIYFQGMFDSKKGIKKLLNLLPQIEDILKEASEEKKKNIELYLFRFFKSYSGHYQISKEDLETICWEEQYDHLISSFPRISASDYKKEQYYNYSYIIQLLPPKRAEKVLLRAFQEPSKAVLRALTALLKCATEKTITAFFDRLAKNPKAFMNNKKIIYICNNLDYSCSSRLVRKKIKEALQTHGSLEFFDLLNSTFGQINDYAKLFKDLPRKKTSNVQRIQNMLADFSQKHNGKFPTERIYLLELSEEEKKNNVIGGFPIGMNADTHPKEDDQYLTFLFHLSFETFPDLKQQFSANQTGVNIFMDTWNDIGSAYLFPVKSNGVNNGGYDYKPLRNPTFFDSLPVTIPSIAFKDLDNDLEQVEALGNLDEEQVTSLGNIKSAINRLPGYVLGQPIWLQEADQWDDDFILQFDESFVPVNLGDNGVMYVHKNGGDFQCN